MGDIDDTDDIVRAHKVHAQISQLTSFLLTHQMLCLTFVFKSAFCVLVRNGLSISH